MMTIDTFISGGISGFFFTLLSHPFHVLTTQYNREIILEKIKPSLSNSINYFLKGIREEKISYFFKGAPIRTLQGTLTYSFLFLSKEYLNNKLSIQNQTVKTIIVSSSCGYIENIVIRQPFLTVSSAYINSDKILNSTLWLNVIKSYPLTSLFRSLYFTSSTMGKTTGTIISECLKLNKNDTTLFSGILGIAFSLHFSAFSESFTNSLSHRKNISFCFTKGIQASKNAFKDINLISRETLFLFPLLFPIQI